MTESDGYQAQWLPHPAVPIRVTFDDQRLYEGVNAYEPWLCRGSFCSVSTRAKPGILRITLTAPPIDTGQASGRTEITGKYDGAGVMPITHDDKALFNVIEVDFYR